jgi:hypothetical protein
MLLANLGKAPLPVTDLKLPTGEALFAHPFGLAAGLASHRLPPRSVAWFLQERLT